MLTKFKKIVELSALSAIVFLSGGHQTHAASLSISNTPLFLGTSVQPNVFFLLDDSGSMDWEILTTQHYSYYSYDPDWFHNGGYSSADLNWYIDDGFFYTFGGNNYGSWVYMYDQSNAYGNNCSGGSTMESCTDDFPPTFDWRFRSSQFNVTFFNPSVTYKPWGGPCGESGEPCEDADFTNAKNNPKYCASNFCAEDWRNLGTTGDTMGGPFKYDVWIDDSAFGSYDEDGNPVLGAFPRRGDNFNEIGVAAGMPAVSNGMVDLWDTHIRITVGTSSVSVDRVTYDPQTSAEASRGLNKDVDNLVTLTNASTCYNILGTQEDVRTMHEQGLLADFTAAGAEGCRTIAEAQTNVANWYTYSRRRMFSMKNAITQVIDAQAKFRYGITKFKGQGSLFIEVPGVDADVPAHNFNLKNELYLDKQEGTGTFLVGGLDAVGQYYSDSYGNADNPIKHSCQKNFQIVFTDGYWNDSTNKYGDVDGDGVSNTAADVAYKYYKTDLDPDMPDNVIPDVGSEDELDPDGDGTTWQHLVTFTVAFGVKGVMDDTDEDGWPERDASGTLWPGDGAPVKSGDWGDPVICGNANCPAKIDDLWHIAWNTNGTYAQASTPEEVVEKLLAAIINIAGRVGSAAAVALNSGTLNANTRVYQAKFNSIDWTGDLLSIPVKDGDEDDTNDPVQCDGKAVGEVCKTEWSASDKLEARAYSTRKIFTMNRVSNTGVDFSALSNLDLEQQVALRTSPEFPYDVEDNSRGQDRIDWVMGRSSFGYDTGFRKRTVGEYGVKKLGDVIASSPAYVGEPNLLFPDSMESEKYSNYAAAHKDRTKMVYVGANDGMLHAFNAATGEEVFAYIPGKTVERLNKLTSPNYKSYHQYFVDGSPKAFDAADNGSWKSLIVGPMGGGDQLVYALDVTNPDSFGTSNVLWEFDDSNDVDMGFSMGDVTYAKMNNGKWAVLIGNGFDNTEDDGIVSATGNAVIYVLDAFTGELLKKLDTGIGMGDDPLNPGSDRPNGIATVTPIDMDGDLIADFLYAGDLFGNVWKVDVSSSSATSWDFAYKSGTSPKPFFIAKDSTGVAQSITTAVSVMGHPTKAEDNLVLFGTGKYFEVGDGDTNASSQVQTFYSIWDDGTGNQYVRNQMLQHKIMHEEDVDGDGIADWRVTTSDKDPSGDYTLSWADHKGWFIDLDYPNGEYGERVIRKAVLRNGRVIFVTLVPNGDPCGNGGSSWIMEMDANTGSRLPESPFDVNGDGIIDKTDILSINSTDMTVSGTRSKEGIVAAPGILNAPTGDEIKYFSGTSGNIDVVLESSDAENKARQSWRQIK